VVIVPIEGLRQYGLDESSIKNAEEEELEVMIVGSDTILDFVMNINKASKSMWREERRMWISIY
jgi:hypothetical protein